MRIALAVVSLVTVGLASADVAHAGSGVFVPPMRIDVGGAVTGLEDRPAVQVVAGVHWASVYPRGRAGFDVGFGVVTVDVADPAPGAAPGGVARATGDAGAYLVGGYGEVAVRTAGTRWWRTWVATRIEAGEARLDGRGRGFVGVATRVSVEAYVADIGGGGGGLILGVAAIGVYGELSVRRVDDVGDDLGASAGLSMRVPLIIGN